MAMTGEHSLTRVTTAMGFDLTILAFTLTYLMKHKARSSLWSLLFTDGLVYFITAFCFNALPAVRSPFDPGGIFLTCG